MAAGGAYFTQEYAFEAAGVCRPSLVAHPDQGGMSPGCLRVILSARAVGEGHICLQPGLPHRHRRSGRACHPRRGVAVRDHGRHRPATLDRETVRRELAEAGADGESLRFVLGLLPDPFTVDALELALKALHRQRLTSVGYSCGGLAHGDTLVLPYGCSDSSIRVAVIDLPGLLTRLHATSRGTIP